MSKLDDRERAASFKKLLEETEEKSIETLGYFTFTEAVCVLMECAEVRTLAELSSLAEAFLDEHAVTLVASLPKAERVQATLRLSTLGRMGSVLYGHFIQGYGAGMPKCIKTDNRGSMWSCTVVGGFDFERGQPVLFTPPEDLVDAMKARADETKDVNCSGWCSMGLSQFLAVDARQVANADVAYCLEKTRQELIYSEAHHLGTFRLPNPYHSTLFFSSRVQWFRTFSLIFEDRRDLQKALTICLDARIKLLFRDGRLGAERSARYWQAFQCILASKEVKKSWAKHRFNPDHLREAAAKAAVAAFEEKEDPRKTSKHWTDVDILFSDREKAIGVLEVLLAKAAKEKDLPLETYQHGRRCDYNHLFGIDSSLSKFAHSLVLGDGSERLEGHTHGLAVQERSDEEEAEAAAESSSATAGGDDGRGKRVKME